MTELADYLDADGYPTDYALGRLRKFEGSPEEFVDFLRTLWSPSLMVDVKSDRGGRGEEIHRVRMVTGGWSGNEDIISELQETMFHMRFWESDHRGGLHVYEVRTEDWRDRSWMGSFREYPTTESRHAEEKEEG